MRGGAARWHAGTVTWGQGAISRAKVQSGAELLCKSAKVGYESMEFRVSSMGAAARAGGRDTRGLEAQRRGALEMVVRGGIEPTSSGS